MKKITFFILLINFFIPKIYAGKDFGDDNNKVKRSPLSYLSPTKSSQATAVKENNFERSLRKFDEISSAKKNRVFSGSTTKEAPTGKSFDHLETKQNFKEQKVYNVTTPKELTKKVRDYLADLKELEEKDNPKNRNSAEVKNNLKNSNINAPLETKDIRKTNKKEEILKKIMQLDQEIVAIENQIIKFEQYDIKEKMNASDLEKLKEPMKKFKDEKIQEKKTLAKEFRKLEEQFPEENFGKDLLSELGAKIQKNALIDKKYQEEISRLKKEQEKKEKEQNAQKEQSSKKGFLGSIKSFFK